MSAWVLCVSASVCVGTVCECVVCESTVDECVSTV